MVIVNPNNIFCVNQRSAEFGKPLVYTLVSLGRFTFVLCQIKSVVK